MIRAGLALLAAGLVACDARTDGDYAGDPMFTLTGTIESRLTSTPDGVKLYLLWAGSNTANLAVDLDTRNLAFPARFTLDVFEPPDVFDPDILSPPVDDPMWYAPTTFGQVIVARPDTDFDFNGPWGWPVDPEALAPGIVGADMTHTLYYFPSDIPEGTMAAAMLHGPQTRGFHIFHRKCLGAERIAEIRACVAKYTMPAHEAATIWSDCGLFNPDLNHWIERAPEDLDTELTVELRDLSAWKPEPLQCP